LKKMCQTFHFWPCGVFWQMCHKIVQSGSVFLQTTKKGIELNAPCPSSLSRADILLCKNNEGWRLLQNSREQQIIIQVIDTGEVVVVNGMTVYLWYN
jgi:hypothetical protein